MVRVAIALLLLVVLRSAALAEGRIALLIGNEGYSAEIGRLSNPRNDIALLEGVLKRLGFDVTTVRDAGLASLHQAVNTHVRRVRQSGPDTVGFFEFESRLIAADDFEPKLGRIRDSNRRTNLRSTESIVAHGEKLVRV